MMFREDERLEQLQSGRCMFDPAKSCTQCFQCIGLINQKSPQDLDIFEAARLLEYKMYQLNIKDFEKKLNQNYRKNGGYERIILSIALSSQEMFKVKAETCREEQGRVCPVEYAGNVYR